MYQIIKEIFIGIKYTTLDILKFIIEIIERYKETAPKKQADILILSKKSFLNITFVL